MKPKTKRKVNTTMHCGICRSPSHNVRRCPHPRPSEEATRSPNTPVGQIAIRRLRKELEQVRDDRECLRIRVASLTKVLENKTGALEEQNFSLQEQLKVIQLVQIRSLQEQLETANMEAKTLQDRLVEKEVQVVEGEKLRKTLLNTIIELKGNIRVFLRVKPVVDGTGIVSCPISTELFGRAIELSKSGGQKHAFDKVFNEEASQQDIFIEVSQLVQSALDGYKVCIFAYGQTGSGKTYTMIGEPDNPNLKGLIPRTLDQIFASSKSLEAEGWEYKMQVSIMEIYNEKIRDLLSKHESKEEYKIHHHANGDTTVPHMTIISVGSANEVSRLLQQAIQNRSVGRTEMNDYSSRSHFVFTLRICGINKNTEQQVQGVLNLIDLAGSDRLSKSGATGDRLKETLAINKSLSSLKNVISALANKEQYVRFRDSKLTYLLQQSLAGDSKALMFVNISPDESSIAESLESLRFAAKANLCERGRALPVQQSSILASPPPNFKPTDDHVLGSSSKAPKTGFPRSNYRSNSKPRLKRTNFTRNSEIR